jgi:ATP/maltotriose-dependent transcriptional regulator MalT
MLFNSGGILLPLLLTKLFMPEITQKHIHREKLLQKLMVGYAAGNQLTLVCAPAGYGKTTGGS